MKHGFAKASPYMFDKKMLTWSLPSGHTCFGADKCLAYADRITGELINGANQEYRCYSAVTERFPSVRSKYWMNYEAVKNKTAHEVADVLISCLPKTARIVRVHVAGDFFHQNYFDGWLKVASLKPNVRFYAFTKSLPLWVKQIKHIPLNLSLIASIGGKFDELITKHKLRYAKVVNSIDEAHELRLQIDYDDKVAALGNKPFALIIAPNGIRTPTNKAVFTVLGKPHDAVETK